MQFNEAVYEYLNDKQNGRKPLRPNTLEGYMSAIKCHLMPKWSDRENTKVTPLIVYVSRDEDTDC